MSNKIIEVQNIKVSIANVNDMIIFVFLILVNIRKESQKQMTL